MNAPPIDAAPNGATAKPPAVAAAPLPTVEADEDASRALSAFSGSAAFAVGQRMARALATSSLMPKAFQGEDNLANVMIAMELANRIGASVFMVAQNLDIIHGRPGWRSQFLIATVNASQRFTPLRFRWQGAEGTEEWGCRCVAKDKATGEECVGSLITMRMAKAEGWSTKPGSKWLTMPEQMCMYRAAAFWTRVYCPELALGISTSEEAQDISTIETVGFEVREPTSASSTADLEARLRAKNPPAPSPAAPSAPDAPAAAPVAAQAAAPARQARGSRKQEPEPPAAPAPAPNPSAAERAVPIPGTTALAPPLAPARDPREVACAICGKPVVHGVSTFKDGKQGLRHAACNPAAALKSCAICEKPIGTTEAAVSTAPAVSGGPQRYRHAACPPFGGPSPREDDGEPLGDPPPGLFDDDDRGLT